MGRVGVDGGQVGGLRRGGGQHRLDELMGAVLLGLNDPILLVRVRQGGMTGRGEGGRRQLHTSHQMIVEGDHRER